jgi:hypothetical protein
LFKLGDKIAKQGESFETATKLNRRVLWASDEVVFYAYGDGTEGYSSAPPRDFVILPQPKRPGFKVGDVVHVVRSPHKTRYTILHIVDGKVALVQGGPALAYGDDLHILPLDQLEPAGWHITRIDWTDDTTWSVTITGTGKIPDWVGETDHPLS